MFLQLPPPDLRGFGLVAPVVPAPAGGAQPDHGKAAELLRPALAATLKELQSLSPDELLRRRHERLRRLATFVTGN